MVDIEWLVETAYETAGMCVFASQKIATAEAREAGDVTFQFSANTMREYEAQSSITTLWSEAYIARELVPIRIAADAFPDGGLRGFVEWIKRKCTIPQVHEENRRLGPTALLQKFGRCFPMIDF